jgi:hypothetical protein
LIPARVAVTASAASAEVLGAQGADGRDVMLEHGYTSIRRLSGRHSPGFGCGADLGKSLVKEGVLRGRLFGIGRRLISAR